ncbi:MAG: alanine racemase [Chitinophagales bacterium]
MKRRKFLKATGISLGGLTLVGAGAFFAAKPKGKSSAYTPTFQTLNENLKNYRRAIPELIIDLDAVDKNIEALQKLIPPNSQYRIVVKSLPSVELVDYVMAQASTHNLMLFHQPFLSHISEMANEQVDILMGKPMPVKTVEYYYDTLIVNNGFDPSKQLQWLVDTDKRINEYIQLAKDKNLTLQLNIEIDVGLHRGGYADLAALKKALQLIEANQEYVTFSGFMGYDPHVVKIPKMIMSADEAFEKVKDYYYACIELLKTEFPSMYHEGLTFNGAGSPTLAYHAKGDSPCNDLAAGSCLVKPTDFDIESLAQFEAACYIATPILKQYENTQLPGGEKMTGILNLWDKNMENSYFIYGGSWMADYYEPPGVKPNKIFGKSTNQVMINASDESKLAVGDFVFLRPHQSEFVFLQFGNILAMRNQEIKEEWSCIRNV